ncbi:MAG: SUMF1/EgtB/PvdO family nonheme iron enzyme [Deltaproteobacteria bacterium]|nr:SUMF1/EgtB/PvdO family nonheme iron enzyme [Deltaproteobacteria bacterium]
MAGCSSDSSGGSTPSAGGSGGSAGESGSGGADLDGSADADASIDPDAAGGTGGGQAEAGQDGACTPGATQCEGNAVLTCLATAQWDTAKECIGLTPTCKAGVCEPLASGPSCVGLAPTCGPAGNASCCASSLVPGGTFKRSYDAVTFVDDTYPATVSTFVLDVYEVTVGRFRKFIDGHPAHLPAAGAGKNPNNPADTGWDLAWNGNIPLDQSALSSAIKCGGTNQTWTDDAGLNESRPITCVTWYEALAFCIWDGGRMPTEAEWNYAASGGAEQRVFPWSNPPTAELVDATYAVYAKVPIAAVGTKSPLGDGRWGHADLGGNAWEWVLDSYVTPYANPCTDCSNQTTAAARVFRGGGASFDASGLLASKRNDYSPSSRTDVGIRCARQP